jgi:Uma2 family endonuclease
VELHPDVSQLVTEDDTPVDNIFSEKQQRLLTEPLYSSWSGPQGNRRFVALANVGLFYAVRQPPYVPDMLLSLDVELPAQLWPKNNRSYFIWEYGKPPELVLEIVANREGGEDSDKLVGYARVGIRFYVIFDPEQLLGSEQLRGYRLDALAYRPMDEPMFFPGLELGLRIWEGAYEGHQNTWLRWVDSEGRLIATGAERGEREHSRAEHEHHRAEEQRNVAEQERKRAERLAEQIRRLGHEPEA